MAIRIYTKTGDKGSTSLIGGTKVPKSHLRIEAYGTVDELNSFIGLLSDHLSAAGAAPAPASASPLAAAASPSPSPSTAVSPLVSTAPAPASASPLAAIASPSPSPSTAVSPLTAASAPPASPSATAEPAVAASPLFPEAQILLREIQDRLFTVGSSLACDPDKEPKFAIPDLHEADIQLLESAIDSMDAELPPMKSFVLPGGHPAVSTAHIARCVCRRAERGVVRLQDAGAPIEPLVLQYLNRLSDYLFELARFIGHRLAVPEIPWKPRV
ncbi:cob(I)yrinic acid a,c-diamide adenosyltransferase [Puia sp.]|jgi:cob(I)alamin adenosyltransferase|uniref:cob(I)yrinic acid a,c-diamide adenosyltransferase n=1 Tax=Puia sp. TaxID=2045100 RepID=UPI002F40CF36